MTTYFECNTCGSDLHAEPCPNDEDCCFQCCECDACEEQRVEDALMCCVCGDSFNDKKQCIDSGTHCFDCCPCDLCEDDRIENYHRDCPTCGEHDSPCPNNDQCCYKCCDCAACEQKKRDCDCEEIKKVLTIDR